MQATGETTIEAMNRDAKLGFTSKAKALVKQLTGNESNAPASPTPTNSSGDNSGGGSPLPVGGDTEIDPDDGD